MERNDISSPYILVGNYLNKHMYWFKPINDILTSPYNNNSAAHVTLLSSNFSRTFQTFDKSYINMMLFNSSTLLFVVFMKPMIRTSSRWPFSHIFNENNEESLKQRSRSSRWWLHQAIYGQALPPPLFLFARPHCRWILCDWKIYQH